MRKCHMNPVLIQFNSTLYWFRSQNTYNVIGKALISFNYWVIYFCFIVKDPEYVAVHEHSKTSTPQGLTQVQFMDKLLVSFSYFYKVVAKMLK